MLKQIRAKSQVEYAKSQVEFIDTAFDKFCPVCGARPGEICINTRVHGAFHKSRIMAIPSATKLNIDKMLESLRSYVVADDVKLSREDFFLMVADRIYQDQGLPVPNRNSKGE